LGSKRLPQFQNHRDQDHRTGRDHRAGARGDGERGMKRTEWYPIRVKPVRVGWYEYRGWQLGPSMRARWNGTYFETWDGVNFCHLADCAGDQWRGLTRPAERD